MPGGDREDDDDDDRRDFRGEEAQQAPEGRPAAGPRRCRRRQLRHRRRWSRRWRRRRRTRTARATARAGVVEAFPDDLAYGHARLPVPGHEARSLVEAGEPGKCDVESAQPLSSRGPTCAGSPLRAPAAPRRGARDRLYRIRRPRRRRRPASAGRAVLRLRQGHQADPRVHLRPLPRRDQAEEQLPPRHARGAPQGWRGKRTGDRRGPQRPERPDPPRRRPRRRHPDAAEEGGRDADGAADRPASGVD